MGRDRIWKGKEEKDGKKIESGTGRVRRERKEQKEAGKEDGTAWVQRKR